MTEKVGMIDRDSESITIRWVAGKGTLGSEFGVTYSVQYKEALSGSWEQGIFE